MSVLESNFLITRIVLDCAYTLILFFLRVNCYFCTVCISVLLHIVVCVCLREKEKRSPSEKCCSPIMVQNIDPIHLCHLLDRSSFSGDDDDSASMFEESETENPHARDSFRSNTHGSGQPSQRWAMRSVPPHLFLNYYLDERKALFFHSVGLVTLISLANLPAAQLLWSTFCSLLFSSLGKLPLLDDDSCLRGSKS